MKVLQINAVYGQGSTGTIVRDIEKTCEQSGIECYVASPDPKVRESKHGYVVGHFWDHKIHALLCRIHGKQAYFSRRATMRLCRYIDHVKPDIVHLHNLHSNFVHLNNLLSHLANTNVKVVITLHDCWYFTGGCFHYTSVGCDKWMHFCGECPKRYLDTPAYMGDRSADIIRDRIKYLNRITDLTIVGVSNWITDELKKSKIKARKILTIHNGVDMSVFKPVELDYKKRLGIQDKKIILGPASKWLLPINKETLDYFCATIPSDTVLVLFGSNQERKDLPTNVVQIGFTRNKIELAALYSSADVMVNCSREDTLSTINLEAQACGTPVVTYDTTGSSETVDGKCGYAINTGDYQKLYEIVKKVLTTGKSSYSRECIRFIQEKFNKDRSYDGYISRAFNCTRGGYF